MSDWSPAQYLRFASERLRPGYDLLGRVVLEAPRTVYDLGCGTGALTAALKGRWPEARVVGVDASESMLAKASEAHPSLEWQRAALETWQPDAAPDLIYSNAALHWLDHHETLFPSLVRSLAWGGTLAVQMPNNFRAPTHSSIIAVARNPRWRDRLEPALRERPVMEASDYHRYLESAGAKRVDIWETTYYHALEGKDPVVEWTKGSILRPVLELLDEDEREAFLELYRDAVAVAYPSRPDGRTLLPFKRLFLVATTSSA